MESGLLFRGPYYIIQINMRIHSVTDFTAPDSYLQNNNLLSNT